jgi:predicted flap endonuclease-1-like 5' DNA nuclease
MTKKTLKKKTAKKVSEGKTLSASTLKKIENKLTNTKEDLESQVEDLSAQVEKVSKKSAKKASKLFKKLDESYRQRLVKLQAEFEARLGSLLAVKNKVLNQLPNILSEKNSKAEITTQSKTEGSIIKSAKPALQKDKKPVSKPQPKVANNTSTPRPKTVTKPLSIASINSIGPVMQKKLAAKDITTLDDIANTPKSKAAVLKQFEKERGFNTWKEQAKALLAAK